MPQYPRREGRGGPHAVYDVAQLLETPQDQLDELFTTSTPGEIRSPFGWHGNSFDAKLRVLRGSILSSELVAQWIRDETRPARADDGPRQGLLGQEAAHRSSAQI